MFTEISVADAILLVQEEKTVIFDVRDEEAYSQDHIKGAKHLSKENFNQVCNELDQKDKILVYCYRGNTSKMIAQLLVQQGFVNICSLKGGFEAWKKYSV